MEETIDISLDELDQAYGGAMGQVLRAGARASFSKPAALERSLPLGSVLPRAPIVTGTRRATP